LRNAIMATHMERLITLNPTTTAIITITTTIRINEGRIMRNRK